MSVSYFVRYDWKDPFPVNRGKAVLMAQLEFETEEAMN